jgi:hypothetical protein
MRFASALIVRCTSFALLLAYGCNGLVASSTARLKTRAQHDLGCPVASLKTREIDPVTAGVSGCGLEAIYVEDCNQLGNCSWLLQRRAPLARPP